MQRRQITLADGRYLIFYTFDEGPEPPAAPRAVADEAGAPHPQAEEERHV